jgi:hypothetical protein
VAPRTSDGGESCLDVFNSHPSRSVITLTGTETPTGTVPNTVATTFETSMKCEHEKDCCELSKDEHWNVEQDVTTGSDNIYYREYDYNAADIPPGTKMEFLSGSETTIDKFDTPDCEKKVVKFMKFIRNTDNCMNGERDHYQVVGTMKGRDTCDCEINTTPSAWDNSACPTTCIDTTTATDLDMDVYPYHDNYFKTRNWYINNPGNGDKSCRRVFDTFGETVTGEVFGETVTDDSGIIESITSKTPCPGVEFCKIDCELNVSSTLTVDSVLDCAACKEHGETDDGFQKYTWTVITAPNYGGSNCADVADGRITERDIRGETKDQVIPNIQSNTFHTTVHCEPRDTCEPTGTFSISETSDENDIGTNSFKFILTDSTPGDYDEYIWNNSIISVNIADLNSQTNKLDSPSNFSDNDDIGETSIIGTVVTVSNLTPDTEYIFVLRRKYNATSAIPAIYSNALTIRTKPIHCDLSVTAWNNINCLAQSCYTTDSPPTKTRTWTVIQQPSETGSNCSSILTDSMFTNESIVGTNSLNDTIGSVITTRRDCDSISQCGQCGYGNWVYQGETPLDWDGSSQPMCESTYTRTKTLNTTDCRNESNLPETQTNTRTNSDSCPDTCSVDNSGHWNETITRKVLRQDANNTQLGGTYKISDLAPNPLPCNSRLEQTTSYSVKDICEGGDRTKVSTIETLDAYTNNDSCVTRPTLGTTGRNITTNSFVIDITSDGLFNTRNATVTKSGVAEINGNSINVTGLAPNTSYAVTLTNTGEDGSTSAYTSGEIITLGPIDCVLTTSSWDGPCNCHGLGNELQRTWTIRSREANGGRNCEVVFDDMKDKQTGNDEAVVSGDNPLSNDTDTFTSTKVCHLDGCDCEIRRKNDHIHMIHDWNMTHCNPNTNRSGEPCYGGYKTREWEIVHTGSGGPRGCTDVWQRSGSHFYEGERLLNGLNVSGGNITGSAGNTFKSIMTCEGDLVDWQVVNGQMVNHCAWEGGPTRIPSNESDIT